MNQAFNYQENIQLYQVDAGSMLFYGQLFFILHNAFAAFLKQIGFSIKDLLEKKEYFYPVVHTEANYSKPLFVGDLVEIELFIEKIGKSSFTVSFNLMCLGKSVADAKVVHVAVKAKTQEKVELPVRFKDALRAYLKLEESRL